MTKSTSKVQTKTSSKKVKTTPPDERIFKLESQLAWYKSFFDNATDAVFIVQPETWSVLDANEYSAHLLGIDKNELIGTNLSQFRRIFKLLKKTSSPSVLSELSFDKPDGEVIMLEVSARFVTYNDEELIQAIARDVSEQHALSDKLVLADKLVILGQLSASVAHEIRNPLAAVNLNLQLMKRVIAPEDPMVNNVNQALQGVERIIKVVENTLNFSRPAMPDIKEMNINSLIPTVLDMVAMNIKRKEIQVDLKLADNLPHVPIDSKQMLQVFINLLNNSTEAIKGKGNITIESYLDKSTRTNEGDYIVVAVSDNGAGIAPDDLQKIFNPFFTRKHDGTGLGLPITQRIMHQHSGIIDVESKLGEGTTFYIKLPIPRSKVN
jgi:PAS domain S-box-containing protein